MTAYNQTKSFYREEKNMSTMTTHERVSRMYQHREADRVPLMDYAWKETVSRWRSEGMPTDDYYGYFDLDKTAYISLDNSPRYPVQVLEETEDYVVKTTPWGATRRNWRTMTSTPENLSFLVDSPDKWLEAKARMTPSDDRIPWDMLKKNYKTWREEGRWITGGFWFGFDITHSGMVGTETLLMAMLEEPEWCMDMFNHELDLDIALMNRVWEAGYHFDELHWYDDMGYKGTQFFSMQLYRELLKPAHQRAIDWGHAHGVKVRLHSCGNINPFVPELVNMGLDALNPLEVKAGMDPVAIKKQYGDQLVLHGGINAALWEKPDELIQEIERVLPVLKENGGYIFASDHSIPPQVSFADFTRVMDVYKRLGRY